MIIFSIRTISTDIYARSECDSYKNLEKFGWSNIQQRLAIPTIYLCVICSMMTNPMRRFFQMMILTSCCLAAGAVQAAGDQSELPKVFILGDSISQGYMGPVQEYLKGKAIVSRPPDNCKIRPTCSPI